MKSIVDLRSDTVTKPSPAMRAAIAATEVETNIVIFEVDERVGSAAEFVQRLREHDVWMLATGPNKVRAVTHLDVSREQIDRAIVVFRKLCSPATAA